MTLFYNMRNLFGGATIAVSSSMFPVVSNAEISASNQSPLIPMIGGCGSTRYGCSVGQGLGIQTPVGNVGVQTPFGGFGLLPSTGNQYGDMGINAVSGGLYNLGRGLGIQTPVGHVGVQTPFGGFNLQGQQSQTAQPVNNQHPSGVYCAFGKQTLLASSIDSCEGAGGQVNPAQMTYNVKCNLSEGIVMAPSNAACARINGKVSQ